MTDYHVHSSYSFDAKPDSKIETLAEAALERGISRLALCDHYDLNRIRCGDDPDIDFAVRAEEIARSNALHPEVTILNGIELGQPTQEHDFAERVLRDYGFEVVIASLHNIRGMPDFYYLKCSEYSDSQLEDLYREYLIELGEIAEWGKFHILAHLTYPLRYYSKGGRRIRSYMFNDYIGRIFNYIIRAGIALEVNTSGYRSSMCCPLPGYGTVAQYIAAGGKLVAAGSDAHSRVDIGYNFALAEKKLRQMGATVLEM